MLRLLRQDCYIMQPEVVHIASFKVKLRIEFGCTTSNLSSIHLEQHFLNILILKTKWSKSFNFCGPQNFLGSCYRTAHGSLNLKPYSTTTCNVIVTHDENAVGLLGT